MVQTTRTNKKDPRFIKLKKEVSLSLLSLVSKISLEMKFLKLLDNATMLVLESEWLQEII